MSTGVAPATLVPRLLLGTSPQSRHLAVEGTVVLVDISGFTVLSERLAAAGRQGTEELIATLSRVFTVLLSATDDGGDVLKFAGDALFVLYTGSAHERRAAHSAWVMQRVLAAIGDIRLRTAAARLRMSVGVHTGRFDVVLTGEQSRNAVIVGGDASHVLRLQSAAGAGRILVSASTARRLPPGQVRVEQRGPMGRRLTGPGAVAAESLMTLRDVAREDATVFLPHAFAERPDLLAAESDHRWAAVGFAAVTGLPDEIDERVLDDIDALTAAVEDVVTTTGTTLLDVDPAPGGFRYFLTAGAPRAIEDPEGSLLAALHRIVAVDSPFALKAGAASGRVFAGFVGAPFRQTYTTMGDATNLAARLTSHASDGTLVAARATADRARAQLTTGSVDTITVKGKSRPIGVVSIEAVGSRRAGIRGDVPFCGRRGDIARLRELLDSATAVTVTGAPGIGKSALVDQVIADLPVVRVAGDRFSARTAYGTMRALLRPLLDIAPDATPAAAGRALQAWLRRSAPELAEWATLVADMIGADCRPSAAVRALDDAYRAERARAVAAELLPVALPADALVVVEDAQWVDAASAAALGAVFSSADVRCLVIRRDGEDGLLIDGPEIEVGALDDEDAATLVERVMGRSPHPGDLARILTRAEGNPLYVVELAGAIDDGEEPRALDELIGERIDALSESHRHDVRAAAVLGVRVPRALFERCVGSMDIARESAVGEFLRVDSDGSGEYVVFRSELYCEVAYDQLAFQDRRRLHRAAADAISADPELAAGAADAMLTVHYEAVGDWESMAAAARRGAEVAERAFAMEDAVAEYRAAVAASRRAKTPRATLQELCESLGRVSYKCGRTLESLEALDQARRLADSPVDRARIDCERAHGLNHLGRPADAVAALRRARRSARAAGTAGRSIEARILVVDGAMRMRQSRWTELLSLSTQAIALLGDHADTPDEKAVLADAYRYHDIAASELEGDEAMVHLQQALELYEELGDALSASKVLTLIGIRAYYRGAWSTAASLYARAEEASEAAGYTVGAALDAANTAEILIDQGRVALARPLLRRAARVAQAAADSWMIASVEGFEARAHLRDGDAGAARAGFDSAAAALDELGETESVLDIRVRRIHALLDLGKVAQARGAIDAIAGDVGESGILASQLLRHRARLARLDGDARQALSLARAAVDAAGSTLYERALSLALVAQLSGVERALLRAEAETILGELGVVDIPRLLGEPAVAPDSESMKSPLSPERGRSR